MLYIYINILPHHIYTYIYNIYIYIYIYIHCICICKYIYMYICMRISVYYIQRRSVTKPECSM